MKNDESQFALQRIEPLPPHIARQRERSVGVRLLPTGPGHWIPNAFHLQFRFEPEARPVCPGREHQHRLANSRWLWISRINTSANIDSPILAENCQSQHTRHTRYAVIRQAYDQPGSALPFEAPDE
jgi:hypothetical protein